MDTARVAIIEDEQEIRECLAILVQSSPGLRLAGTFGTMTAALARLPLDPPDVALVDIGLPDMSGIEGVRRLKQQLPTVRTLILTVYEDNARVFDALCAGASGYLLKRTPPERLLEAVHDVMSGGAAMSPEVARKVVELFTQFRPPGQTATDLTPHELRLLTMLKDGHSYRSAGAMLGVTAHAVSFHLRNIYEKLQVHSKTEAVAKALQRRLIE
jgi:DNA-binding NarL/FixJ family response regulator